MKHQKILPTALLKAMQVKNRLGQHLGVIKNVAIDGETGRIAYAVLSFSDLRRMTNKLFAVPWNALTRVPDRQLCYLDVDADCLERASGFSVDKWPTTSFDLPYIMQTTFHHDAGCGQPVKESASRFRYRGLRRRSRLTAGDSTASPATAVLSASDN